MSKFQGVLVSPGGWIRAFFHSLPEREREREIGHKWAAGRKRGAGAAGEDLGESSFGGNNLPGKPNHSDSLAQPWSHQLLKDGDVGQMHLHTLAYIVIKHMIGF